MKKASILDPENYSITKFVEESSKKIDFGSFVLDAGAGSCPYKEYFSAMHYESCDFAEIFDKKSSGKHDFICDLADIPRPENSYDVVLNTQVLEHVPDPQKVLCEFYRILKPGGRLFLTAPQGWGIHGAPHHYFNFTRYGLKYLLEKAGFKNIVIKERGGMFWYLSKRISNFPWYILHQYKPNKQIYTWMEFILVATIYILALPLCHWIIPISFFYLDRFDLLKAYTLGYSCVSTKG